MSNPNLKFTKKSKAPLRVIMVDGKKKLLTRTVRPSWYTRYAHVLNEDERMFEQPTWDRKRDRSMWAKEIRAQLAQTNHTLDDDDLAKRVVTDHYERIDCALAYVEGRKDKVKEKMAQLNRRKFTFRPHWTDLAESDTSSATGLDYFDRKNFRLPEKSRWHLIKNNKVIASKIKSMSRDIKRAVVVHRWQKGISTVRAVLRFWNIVSQIAATTSAIFAEFEKIIHAGEKDEKIENMFFDKSKYNRPLQSSRELDLTSIMTLRDLESLRSEHDIKHAAKSLRCLKAFAEYPLRHQMIMARIGQYIEIPADKVIIREGQPPHNFYFLLSGKAVAVKMTGSLIYGKGGGFEVIKGYEQGAIFGDEGLYDCDFRAHSVSSVTQCQIISVNIDDHIRKTLMPEPGSSSADHLKFVSKLEMMRKFPLGRLIDDTEHVNTRNIIFFYFHPGRLITRKKYQSKYVFVVKTGSCRVLAEMTECLGPSEMPLGYRVESIPELNRKTSHVDSVVVSAQISQLNMHFKQDGDSECFNALIPIDTNENATNKCSPRLRLAQHSTSSNSNTKATPVRTCNKTYHPRGESDKPKPVTSGCNRLPRIAANSYISKRNANISDNASTNRKVTIAMSAERLVPRVISSELLLGRFSSSLPPLKYTSVSSAPRLVESGLHPDQGGRMKTQMWLFLQDLKEGDVFGLEDFDLGDEVKPTCDLAVVSEGCEMILISKEFLLNNMSEQMKDHWRQLGKHHPDEETVVTKLKSDEHWRRFKRKVQGTSSRFTKRL